MNPFSFRHPVFPPMDLAKVLLAGLAAQFCTLAMLFFLVRFLNALLVQNVAWTSRSTDLWAILICVLAGQGFRFIYGLMSSRMAAHTVEKLRKGFWNQLLSAPVLPNREAGNTAQEGPSRIAKVVDALEPWYGQFLPQSLLAVIIPVGILVAVFSLDPLTGLVLALTGPLLPLFLALLGIRAKAKAERQWRTLAGLRFLFLESLHGLKTLKIFGRSQNRLQELEKAEEDFRTRTLEVLRSAFLSALVLEWGATLGTALVAVEVALRLLTERLDFFSALLVLLWTPEFYRPIRQMGLSYHASLDARTAYKDHPELFRDHAAAHPSSEKFPDNKESSNGGVTLQLTWAENAPLAVAPGSPLVVTGPSGTGKTRMLLNYLGLVQDPGVPELLSPRIPWHSVGWLPQQSLFFAGTLWDNLCPHGRQSESKVWAALDKAGLREWRADLPGGLEALVQEQGRNFSGGERRRLALARLLLLDRPLWILDEPLAGLDAQSAAHVLNVIEQEARSRTLVMVTHQLDSLRRAGRVCFMRNGYIEAVGTHDELRAHHIAYRQTVEKMEASV